MAVIRINCRGCPCVVPWPSQLLTPHKDPAGNAASASTASFHLPMACVHFISVTVVIVSFFFSFYSLSFFNTPSSMSYRSVAYYVNWYGHYEPKLGSSAVHLMLTT